MSLVQIVMRLARNPGFPDGDRRQGYVLTAPLDERGLLNALEWQLVRHACKVSRFAPGETEHAGGLLQLVGPDWFFDCGPGSGGDGAHAYRLADHQLRIGDYVTLHEADGEDLTYRVDQHICIH